MKKGEWGENIAAAYLEQQGYQILARNFRVREGELDIVASKGEYLAFVEVKTRKNDRYGMPCEYITKAKQKRLVIAAEYWLWRNPTNLQPRFDAVEIYGAEGCSNPRIEHLVDIFEA